MDGPIRIPFPGTITQFGPALRLNQNANKFFDPPASTSHLWHGGSCAVSGRGHAGRRRPGWLHPPARLGVGKPVAGRTCFSLGWQRTRLDALCTPATTGLAVDSTIRLRLLTLGSTLHPRPGGGHVATRPAVAGHRRVCPRNPLPASPARA